MLMPIKYLACEKTNRELQDIIQILIEGICHIKTNVNNLVIKVRITKFLVANAVRKALEFQFQVFQFEYILWGSLCHRFPI